MKKKARIIGVTLLLAAATGCQTQTDQQPALSMTPGVIPTNGGALPVSTTPSPAATPVVQLTWASVATSNDITKYAAYLEQRPKEHVEDIRVLVDAYFQKLLADAAQSGKSIVHNARQVYDGDPPAGSSTYALPRGIMHVGGGQLPLKDVTLYSDPTNPLGMVTRNYGYLDGKGMAVATDKVYCFGF